MSRDWMLAASCRESDSELWFASMTGGKSADARAAIRICSMCPVRVQCLLYAISLAKRYELGAGIWAGQTAAAINRLVRP